MLSGTTRSLRRPAAQVLERDYEGMVAKDETGAYECRSTRRWLKVKQKDWTVAEDRWQRRISVNPDRTARL